MDRFFVQSQEKRENQRGDFACLQYHAKDDYKPPRCVSLSVHAVARLDTNAQNQDSGSSAICAVMQDWTLLSHCRTPGADRKGQSRPGGLCRASLLFCWTVRRGKQQLDGPSTPIDWLCKLCQQVALSTRPCTNHQPCGPNHWCQIVPRGEWLAESLGASAPSFARPQCSVASSGQPVVRQGNRATTNSDDYQSLHSPR